MAMNRAFRYLSISLLLACGQSSVAPTDGSPPECVNELPLPECPGGSSTVPVPPLDSSSPFESGETTTGTVVAIEEVGEHDFQLTLEGAAVTRFDLPARPDLAVGATVTLVPEGLGWRLEAGGSTVAFVGVTSHELRWEGSWPASEGESAGWTVADVPLTLTPTCAYWANLADCGTSVPREAVVSTGVSLGGVVLAPMAPHTFELGDGRTVTAVDRSTWIGATATETCDTTCLLPRPTAFGVTLVFSGPERSCAGLPAACDPGTPLTSANPAVLGTLTEGEWTVGSTSEVAGDRVLVVLEMGDDRVALDLPADPLFEPGEVVTVTRDDSEMTVTSADGESALFFGPRTLPGDRVSVGGFDFTTSPACGAWAPHPVSPDLCPAEAVELLTLTIEGAIDIRPGEVVEIDDAQGRDTVENRGVLRTVEDAELGDRCAGCLDPAWGRSAVLVVRSPLAAP
jgi:hypothetical protein